MKMEPVLLGGIYSMSLHVWPSLFLFVETLLIDGNPADEDN